MRLGPGEMGVDRSQRLACCSDGTRIAEAAARLFRRLTTVARNGKARAKGYRIMYNLDLNVFAIMRALVDAGFECWLPAEKRLVRDYRHTDLWKVRRFALMVGYVFVKDPADFGRLASVLGVSGDVCDGFGRPLSIDFLDIPRRAGRGSRSRC